MERWRNSANAIPSPFRWTTFSPLCTWSSTSRWNSTAWGSWGQKRDQVWGTNPLRLACIDRWHWLREYHWHCWSGLTMGGNMLHGSGIGSTSRASSSRLQRRESEASSSSRPTCWRREMAGAQASCACLNIGKMYQGGMIRRT
jgi:hypothetical protein